MTGIQREYPVVVGGIRHTFLYDDTEAERLGLRGRHAAEDDEVADLEADLIRHAPRAVVDGAAVTGSTVPPETVAPDPVAPAVDPDELDADDELDAISETIAPEAETKNRKPANKARDTGSVRTS